MTAESITLLQRLSWILNIFFHQILAVLVVYILTTVFVHHDIKSLSTWHMVLTPLGFLLLTTESLILFMNDNIYTIYMKRSRKHYIHSALQILSTIFITVGIAFKISSKNGSHFSSRHGILGLIAWILVWCSVFLGIATSKAHALKNFVRPALMKLCHILLGFTGYTMGFLTLGFGLKLGVFNSNENTVVAAIVGLVVVYVWALVDTAKSTYAQIRNILGK